MWREILCIPVVFCKIAIIEIDLNFVYDFSKLSYG